MERMGGKKVGIIREQDGMIAVVNNFREVAFSFLIWFLVGNCFKELSLCLVYPSPAIVNILQINT